MEKDMENQTSLEKLNQKISQILGEYNSLKEQNELFRVENMTLKTQNEAKDAEIAKLEDENIQKDIEIEEIVQKIESMIG
jgi:cell division protein FtsB